MTQTERFFVKCIKIALEGKELENLPDDIDYKNLFELSLQHSVVVIVYYAFGKQIEKTPKGFQQAMQVVMTKHIAKEEQSRYDKQVVVDVLEEKGVPFMPLKGYFLKQLYPKTEMRYTSDCDILVDVKKMKEIHKIFKDLGYLKEKEDTHHDIFYNPQTKTIFEMHKTMFVGALKKYFGVGFERAKLVEGKQYFHFLSENDLYISVLGHYAYHFDEGAGVGMRSLCDIRVMQKAFGHKLDNDYINTELEKCGLKVFKEQFEKVVDYLFDEREATGFTKELAEYILQSSLFSNKEHSVANKAVKTKIEDREKAKKKAIVRRIFPKKETIYYTYPWIKKVKILLPLGYVIRWFRVLIKSPERIKEINELEKIDQQAFEKIKHIKEGLKLNGLTN